MRKFSLIVLLFFAVATPVCAQGSATGLKIVIDNCDNDKLDPDTRIQYCTEIIHSNLLISRIAIGIYVNRGLAYVAKGDLDDAQKDYEKAISLEPGYWVAHHDLGILFEKKNDSAGASSEYERAGFDLLKDGKCKDAIEDYGYALQDDPKNAAALYGSGLCEKRAGQDKVGQTDQDAAIAIDPAIARKYDWPR